MRTVGALVCATLLYGCGVGDETGNEPDLNPNGLRCSAASRTTGTFTESTSNPRPIDPLGPDGEAGTPDDNSPLGGCWPVGVWTFSATEDTTAEVIDITGDDVGDRCGDVSGTAAPVFEASYSFRVDRVDDGDGFVDSFVYLGGSPNFVRVQVSADGGGDCQGSLEFASADKREWWTFNPTICTSDNCEPASTAITGTGDYTRYIDPEPGL